MTLFVGKDEFHLVTICLVDIFGSLPVKKKLVKQYCLKKSRMLVVFQIYHRCLVGIRLAQDAILGNFFEIGVFVFLLDVRL